MGPTTMTTPADDITYCVGLWLVPGNRKRCRDHYIKHLPNTLKLLHNKKVIFLYEDEPILQIVRDNLNTEYLFTKKIQINEMKAYQYADQLIASAKKFKVADFTRIKLEKGLIHYKRDLMGSGEDAYKAILTVWLSKVSLIQDHAIAENPFSTSAFAWVDASISRLAEKQNAVDIVNIGTTDKILMRGSGMRYKGKRVNFAAGFILATIENWRILSRLYDDELSKATCEAYPNDEEILLHKISIKNPDLFRKIERTEKKHIIIIDRIREICLNFYHQSAYFLFICISKIRNLNRP